MPDPDEEISLRDTIKQSIKEVTGEEYAPPPPEGSDIPDEIVDEFREREGIRDEETAENPDSEAPKADTNVPDGDKPADKPDPATELLSKASPEIKALFEEQAPIAKLGREISEVFAPFAEIVKASGMSEAKIVEGWIGLYNMARQDPTGYATHMLKSLQGYDKAAVAQALGIEAAKPTEAPAEQKPDDDDDIFADPEVKALKKELAELKAARTAPQQPQQPQATPEQIAQRAIWEDRIQQFANEKDASGQPVNKHFNALQREMATLATAWRQEGRTFTVRELYEGAIPMNPNISALVQASRKEAAEAADRQRKQAAIEKAKRASSSVRSDDEATVRPTKFDDLDQRSQIVAIAKGLKVVA